ncbi:MAG: ABC transporter substrate-binding protein [Candidatus Promineifilaceae bacterium]|nr:ABC transporter substrate-binding protein [Candidatus Promineifilaceae bacterium]
MTKRNVLLSIVLIIGVLALVACGAGEAAQVTAEPIKIGAIHDLTGATSDVGTPYADGIRDFVKWFNEQGGIDGHEIELLSQDYAYAVDQAEQLYSQYTSDGVVAFQGWGTGDTEALRGRIAEDEIPFMSASYSATLGDPNEAPYNFLIGTTYSDQFIIAIQYAQENSADGAPTIALLHHDSPFGTSPLEDGKAFAEANGMEVIGIPMPGGATDFTAELTRVADAGAEFIVIQNVSSPAATLTKDVARLGMDTQIICLNWCADELFVELAGDAAEGVIAASPFAYPNSGVSGLADMQEYTEANDKDLQALGVHYVQGWTTMKAMADAIQKVVDDGNEVTGPNIKAALETFSNYSTGDITAPITFTSSDHAGNKALQLFQVSGGTYENITDFIQAGS